MGRPSTYTQAAADEIIERVAAGEPLAKVCREPHLPAVATFREWVKKDDGLSSRLAYAREDGFDVIAADCLQIVDDGANNPQHAKVRADTRLKLLAVWDPTRFGAVQQLRLAGNEGQSLRDVSESEAATRVASILEAVRRRSIPLLSEGGESGED